MFIVLASMALEVLIVAAVIFLFKKVRMEPKRVPFWVAKLEFDPPWLFNFLVLPVCNIAILFLLSPWAMGVLNWVAMHDIFHTLGFHDFISNVPRLIKSLERDG